MRTPKHQRQNRKRLLAVALLGFTITLPLAAETPQDTLPGLGVQPVEYFYTGKPYDTDTESYTFKYRSYDPELNRWTTADPSGFPDGANSFIYINNHPLSSVDFAGLVEVPFSAAISYTIDGTGVILNPSTSGVFTYTLDENNKHFTSSGGSWVGPESGDWAYSIHGGNSYIISMSTIKKTNGGIYETMPDENGIVWKTDWIVISAYFDLTMVRITEEGTLTSHIPILITEMEFKGSKYE